MIEQDQTRVNLRDHRSEHTESLPSQPEIKHKEARDHSSTVRHEDLVRDSQYRRCVPLGQRFSNWFSSTFRCMSSESSFVEKLDNLQRKYVANLSDDIRRVITDKIMKIRIIQTSRLQLDSNVIHPFVKVHIIDKNTGCYLAKDFQQEYPMIYHRESITFFDNQQGRYDSSDNNILLPFATNMCDFRELGNSIGKWNEEFYINYPAEKLLKSQTLFLFEILDFNHQALLYKDTDIYDRDNFYRVAWGYLRPVGMGKTHLGKSKIQLYRYKFNNKKALGNFNKSFIPPVYYDFLWNNHEKYEGFLTVQLIFTDLPRIEYIKGEKQYAENLFEEERMDSDFLRRLPGRDAEDEEQQNKINQNLLKFYRNRGICQIPKELVYKFESEKLGCYRTLFVGNYLFAACPSKKSTNIKVYSMEKGEKRMTLKGHREMIYSLSTTQNERYLISAGSDHTVRIWEIPQNLGEYIDEDESQGYLRGQCIHTAAVYSVSSIHVPLTDKIYLLSCCYDGYIRLWEANLRDRSAKIVREININQHERGRQKVYPTACAVLESNFFVVGDSTGEIRVFDFARETINLTKTFYDDELKNDAILGIKILNKNHLLIQASDNLLRHFELTNKLRMVQKFSGAQFESHLTDFCVSSDNQYLLSPSENGKPFMWDLRSGLPVPLEHLNLEIKGPLVTCSWHPKYNLVSFGGFVQLCPVLVYGNILSEAEQKLVAAATK